MLFGRSQICVPEKGAGYTHMFRIIKREGRGLAVSEQV
jgi:hypothetical protein